MSRMKFKHFFTKIAKNSTINYFIRKNLFMKSFLFTAVFFLLISSPTLTVELSSTEAKTQLSSFSENKFQETYSEPYTGMEFVYIKGGCYQMGDTFGDGKDNEKPVHEVCISQFYMSKFEVTQGQWRKVMGNNPVNFRGDNYPIETISWNEAQEFIRKFNRNAERKYRLPTEAQWEYACRSGGKKEKYAGSDNLDSVAWHSKNSDDKLNPVGTKLSNGLGIYDMIGNVAEWTQDWYDKNYYYEAPKNNPKGLSQGAFRVFRGGSRHQSPGVSHRCTYRNAVQPSLPPFAYIAYTGIGFRLVGIVK